MVFDPYSQVEEIKKEEQIKAKKKEKKKEAKAPVIFNISIDEEIRLREILSKVFNNKPDPLAYAQLLISNACSGRNMNGRIWRNAPDDLYDRIEILSGGLVSAEMLRSGSSADAILEIVKKERSRRGRPKGSIETIGLPKDLEDFHEKYGNVIKKEVKHFLNLFPKLNNPVDKSFVEQLVMVRLLMKEMLIKATVQSGAKTYAQTMEKLANIERQLMETLGISARQRQQLIDKKKSGSIADLVEMAELFKDDYREVELRMFLEEIMILLQRYRRGELSKHMFVVLTRLEPDEAISLLLEYNLIDEEGNFKAKALDRFKSLDDLERKWKEYSKKKLNEKVRRI